MRRIRACGHGLRIACNLPPTVTACCPCRAFVSLNPKMSTGPKGRDRGAGSRNRTHDQRFTKPLLYQLSYAGLFGILLALAPPQATIDGGFSLSLAAILTAKSRRASRAKSVTRRGLHERAKSPRSKIVVAL